MGFCTSNARTRAMQNEYGIGNGTCKRCCNLQFAPGSTADFICIAYGQVHGLNCSWSEDFSACGLFNRPFHALRPSRRPLAELSAPGSRSSQPDASEQISLF